LRGPLGTSFTNVVSGLVSIRSYERLGIYRQIFINDLDKSCNATFTFFTTLRLFNIRIDIITIFVTMIISLVTVMSKDTGKSNEDLAFSL